MYIQLGISSSNGTDAMRVQCTGTNQKTSSVSILSLLLIWLEVRFFRHGRKIARRSTGWSSWLRQRAKSPKVAGSIYDVTGIFHWINPWGCTVPLWVSFILLTEMSTKDIAWGKDGRCVRLTTLPPSCTDCLEILGTSTSCSPKGLSGPVMGQLYFSPKLLKRSISRFSFSLLYRAACCFNLFFIVPTHAIYYTLKY